jgi:type VI secretion system protein ImpK
MSTTPSLYLDTPKHPPRQARQPEVLQREPRSLSDLMHDGMYLLFLLRNEYQPMDMEDFAARVDAFFNQFEKHARKMGASLEDIADAKYAFCALLDEAILNSACTIRSEWELKPLQLRYFGDHLAGENFFKRLEDLRHQGAHRVQALEVYHLCLLLGFQGKYVFEGTEKLNYLISRVGEEVQHHKGARNEFAPHWRAPDEIRNIIRNEVPLWVFFALLAVIGLVALFIFDWLLGRQVQQGFAQYVNIIQPYLSMASVTITLP